MHLISADPDLAGVHMVVGLSNFATWQLASAYFIGKFEAGVRISSAQLQYNLAFREEERDMLPFCNETDWVSSFTARWRGAGSPATGSRRPR